MTALATRLLARFCVGTWVGASALSVLSGNAAEPPAVRDCYVKKATWVETILATRAAVSQ